MALSQTFSVTSDVYRTKISCRCKLVVGMMQHGVYQPSNAHAAVLLEFLQHPRSTKASHCRNSVQGFLPCHSAWDVQLYEFGSL